METQPPLQQIEGQNGHWLVRWRMWFLAGTILALACAWPGANRLQFDRRLESMFAANSPLLPAFRRLQRTFGGSDLVLAVYADEQLLASDRQGLARLTKIREQIQAVPGVANVLSLDRVLLPLLSPMAASNAGQVKLFEGYTHGADGRTAALVCQLTPEAATKVTRTETIAAIRRIMREHPQGCITGEPVMIADGFELVERDGRRLMWLSTLLLGATLLACFRSVRWVLASLAVVHAALLGTQGLVAVAGVRLSMVSSMLAALVNVVGIAAAVHLIVRGREEAEKRRPSLALTVAGTELARPIFWSCLTDALGFATLMLARAGPVRDFGLMTSIGSLGVFLALLFVFPGVALAFRRDVRRGATQGSDAESNAVESQTTVERDPLGLQRVAQWSLNRPGTVLLVTLGLTLIALYGAAQVEVESDFTRNFRAGSPVVAAYEVVEEQLGGAGVWDVLIPAPAVLNVEFLERVSAVQQRLREELGDLPVRRPFQAVENPSNNGGLTKVLSLADVVSPASSMPGGFGLANLHEAVTRSQLEVFSRGLPEFYRALHHVDPETGQAWLRILLRSRERQPSADKLRLIGRVEEICRSEFPEAEVTGPFVLLAHLIEHMLADNWRTFGASLLGVGVCLLIAFRSWRLTLAVLLPNCLPIFLVLAVLGWCGGTLNMGAAMIAAVSLGLSVDGSIHYVFAYLDRRRHGDSVHHALLAVQRSTGRALVLATLALAVGFSALAASDFVPTIYFGVLVSLAMIGGQFGNLLVLPAGIAWLHRHEDL